MHPDLIPRNDVARLDALRRYQVLDFASERVFDELAQLTALLFRAPIALLSLVDETEVLFKGNYGLPSAGRVERHLSLCSAAVLQNETLVLPDLDAAPCRLTDPLLAEQLGLKFYAGHVLQTDHGYNIGTLCVIDRRPRAFGAADDALLTTLAIVAMRLLDLRLALDATAATSFALWEPAYGAIQGQFEHLRGLAERRGAPPTCNAPLTDAMTQEVAVIAAVLDRYIATTLARV